MKQTRWFAVLFFLVLTQTALAEECPGSFVLQPDGSCAGSFELVEEGVIVIAPPVDIDPAPYPHIDADHPPIFVSGGLHEYYLPTMNWLYASRPALSELERRVEATLAQQLGVPVDNVLRRRAHGQINSLLYITIIEIINTSAAYRDDFEQQVYAEVQQTFSDRRLQVAILAAEEYNRWQSNPCGYKVPVGDDPDAYLNQYGVESYCLASEFGNPLVLAFTNTPAIPSSSYLLWATHKRLESLRTVWAYVAQSAYADDIVAATFANAYADIQQGMAYHLAWGTLSSLPGFNFDDIYSDDPTVASLVHDAVAVAFTDYFRDFLPTLLINYILTGPTSLKPDPWDIAILTTALAVHSILEIVSQAESRQGIEEAMVRSFQSLEVATNSDAGRAELLMLLIELNLSGLVSPWGGSLPGHDMPVPGVFYSTESPQNDRVHLGDWGTNYSVNDAFNAHYLFSDQQWLGRSLGFPTQANPRYDGFTSHIRFVTPEGDLATAWLIKGRDNTYREFLITPYARVIRDRTDNVTRVRVERRFNNDCPARGSYNFNTPPTDNGMSCVVIEYGLPVAGDLAPGDSVIIAGRVAEVRELFYSGTDVTSFSTQKPVTEGGYLSDQVIRKIELGGGSGVPTDRFEYLTQNGSATAILDFAALPPEIQIANPHVVAEAHAILSVVNLGAVTAMDPTEGVVAVTSNAPEAFPLGMTTVTYVASDSDGNSATATQTVTVVDTTVPYFPVLPQAMSVEATANPMPVTLDTLQAIDIFPVTVTSDAPVDGFPLGDTVVSWTGTDTSGNSAIVLQTVTITDTTPPVFTSVPADFTMEATGPLTVVNPGTAIATDVFDVTVSHDVPDSGVAVGVHTVTWTAVDANDNQSQATQTVTVVDTTPPSISLEPWSIQVEASAVLSLIDLGNATAMDLVDGDVAVDHDAPAAFPLGTTLVTYSAVDSRGNLATATQTVIVVDTTPPEFTVLPLDIERIADGPSSNVNLGSVEASDIFAVTVSNDAPEILPVGTTVVTWTAADTSGNTATVTQTIRLSYQYGGFKAPVVANGVYRVNRVLPLRFSLTYADGAVAETAKARLSVTLLEDGDEASDPLGIDSAGSAGTGNSFQYRGGSFQYNFATRSLTSGMYRLTVTLDDGNHYTLDIVLNR